jgi:hypothetical protein
MYGGGSGNHGVGTDNHLIAGAKVCGANSEVQAISGISHPQGEFGIHKCCEILLKRAQVPLHYECASGADILHDSQ